MPDQATLTGDAVAVRLPNQAFFGHQRASSESDSTSDTLVTQESRTTNPGSCRSALYREHSSSSRQASDSSDTPTHESRTNPGRSRSALSREHSSSSQESHRRHTTIAASSSSSPPEECWQGNQRQGSSEQHGSTAVQPPSEPDRDGPAPPPNVHRATVHKTEDTERFVLDLLARYSDRPVRVIVDEGPTKVSVQHLHRSLKGVLDKLTQAGESLKGLLLEAEEGEEEGEEEEGGDSGVGRGGAAGSWRCDRHWPKPPPTLWWCGRQWEGDADVAKVGE